jgi:(p)ppGpp synthase/HD superfamily hydrolase
MPTDPAAPGVVLDRKFVRAVRFACDKHRKQAKKGGDVPYVAHLLGVASLVLEDGGSRNEAVAGLLHDVLEDTDTKKRELRKRFGRPVTRIVVGCSEKRKGKPEKPWRMRKERTIAHLNDPDTSPSVLRVKAADSLYNARAILADLRRHGPETWLRFNAGAVDQLWYYRSLSVVLSARLPGMLSDELRVTVRQLEEVAGWWFDVGDPQSGSGAPTR